MARHIADAESKFTVLNVTPDFCRVDGEICPFDISQVLSSELCDYAPDFFARGGRVLHEGSIIDSVEGNAGEGVESGVSQADGHTVMLEGTDHFLVHGKRVCRHEDLCAMNVRVG